MNSILKNKYNIFSQNGEDGIIDYIFTKLNIHKGTFIEFGAWDGKYLSNSYNLFLNKEWNGIYIEADSDRYKDLMYNFRNFRDRIDCVNELVGFTENNNLDTLIETHSTKRDFDFVSIDVDGLDYFIFTQIKKYLPKVICIEVNAGHHPEYPYVIPENIASNNIGQSIKVISSLATTKGYFPLCYTGNLFLVKNEYIHLFRDDIRTFSDMYIEFLQHLDRDGVLHLKNTFVLNKVYNNFIFENEALENFCKYY
jgi:hypothetical protein